MKTPLLVILARRGNPSDSERYAAALREVFAGACGVQSASRALLQAAELREFVFDADALSFPQPVLSSAQRTVVVVLDARSHSPDRGTLNDSELSALDALRGTGASALVVNVLLQTVGSLFEPALHGEQVLRLGLADLEERDLRIPFLVLYALHGALRLFALPHTTGAGKPGRLFFSHAKRDGVPLTTAVFEWMKRLRGFEAFYDTHNLDLDGDIEAQLRDAVSGAVVIVFRTDVFDQRYWCQKEVVWAELHGRPVITVDARWQIEHSPSVVGFDSTPVVRIPDGNLVRIFSTALVEALRIELFRARASMLGAELGLHTSIKALPRFPSLVSLHEACRHLKDASTKNRYIVYPNPSLPSVLVAAAESLADASVPGCRVLSLDELRFLI